MKTRILPRAMVVGSLASLAVWAFEAKTSPETATAAPASQGPDPVIVANSAAQPVPIGGAVQVSNLPAVQNVVGTVQIANLPPVQAVTVTAPERRWGSGFVRIAEPMIVIPEDVVLTDLVISLGATNTTPSCRVALHRLVSGGVGTYYMYRLSEDHPVAELHLATGIATSRLNAYSTEPVNFGIHLVDGDCLGYAMWSGYTRTVPAPLPAP